MPDHAPTASTMKDSVTWLYPPIEPYKTGRLQVSPVHEIYFEESGKPSGKPVIFLHGGPGGGSDPKQRRFFHPDAYRIVNFDQRGCGKSTPYASLEANTTWDLVADIEKIREHLGIERSVGNGRTGKAASPGGAFIAEAKNAETGVSDRQRAIPATIRSQIYRPAPTATAPGIAGAHAVRLRETGQVDHFA